MGAEGASMPLPDWIARGAPHEVILDPVTGLEGLLGGLGCLSLMAAPAGAITFHVGRWELPGAVTAFWLAAAIGLVLVAAAILLDDHFVLDLEERALFFVRRFAGRVWKTRVCPFAGLFCLAVDCDREPRERGAPLYYYGLQLVCQDGRRLPVTPNDRRDYRGVVEAGRTLSQLSELRLHPPVERRGLRVRRRDGRLELTYRP